MTAKVIRPAGALLALLAASCLEDPLQSGPACQYGIYPPAGVQLRPGETRFVQSTSSCDTGQGPQLLQPSAWTSSDSMVVGVRPEPTSTGATLRAYAVGNATITASFAGSGQAAHLQVQVVAGP